MTKFTFKCEQPWLIKASQIASRYLRDKYGKPTWADTQANCVLIECSYAEDKPPVRFNVWGDEKHIRVYQHEETLNVG